MSDSVSSAQDPSNARALPAEDQDVITFADIDVAAKRIRGLIKRTPVMTSRGFDTQAGVNAFFKCENFQTCGAFKMRGAANFLYSIPEEERDRGVVAYSSGNHALAVTIAAQSLGMSATLVMPDDAPRSKIEAVRERGGKIVLYDRFTEDRVEIAKRIAEESGAAIVPPFDHPWIMAGAGTWVPELMGDAPNLDALIVCIGGGGLISGSAIAAKHLNPKIQVIGVEPVDGNDTYLSMAAGKRTHIPAPKTIADGLRAQMPGALTFPIIQKYVDEIVLVTEEEIRATVKFLLARMKIVAEPSGAVPAAAVLFHKLPVGLGRVGVLISGGNVDYEVLAGL